MAQFSRSRFRLITLACLTSLTSQLLAPAASADVYPSLQNDKCTLHVTIDQAGKRYFQLSCSNLSEADARMILDPSIGYDRADLVQRMEEVTRAAQHDAQGKGIVIGALSAVGGILALGGKIRSSNGPVRALVWLAIAATTIGYSAYAITESQGMSEYKSATWQFNDLIDDKEFQSQIPVYDVAWALSHLLRRPKGF
jgi:hypothetical protein